MGIIKRKKFDKRDNQYGTRHGWRFLVNSQN